MSRSIISAPHKKRKKRRPPKPPTRNALAHRIGEFVERARTSRPTAYRMMKEGTLRYIVVRGHRLIPTSEYARLGYVEAAASDGINSISETGGS